MEPAPFSEQLKRSASGGDALGNSDAFLDFQERLAKVAKVQRPVLLIGEPGTGKEFAAARLHYLSQRWNHPYLKLNCAALAPTILESELFGHEAGAFTGATRRRVGRFEAADGGTLFLDEIGQMPILLQEKILRVVEYGSFERVGTSEPVTVNVRLIGATNADLPSLVREGKFKRDLLDRLSFEVLYLPSLRERGSEDIELLTNHFTARMSAELGRDETPEFSERAMNALRTYPWPGNIRELKNVVERAVYKASGKIITEINFNPFLNVEGRNLEVQSELPEGEFGPTERTYVKTNLETSSCDLSPGFNKIIFETEKKLLQQALVDAQYNQRKAAQLLHLTYDQFRGLYRRHKKGAT